MSTGPHQSDAPPGLHSEIGHVLAIDLVGLSRFTRDEQPGVITEFQRLVMGTPQARESLNANRLLIQRQGHTMLLVFLGDPLSAVKCALQAANEARRRPNILLRMGIHSGPVYLPADLTDERDCTGEALTGAAILMTAGKKGHILASEPPARAAAAVALWEQYIHDLGNCEIRPGTMVRLFNLHGGSIGNPSHPLERFTEPKTPKGRGRPRRFSAAAAGLALLLLLAAGSAAAWFTMADVRTWTEAKYRGMFPAAVKTPSQQKVQTQSKARTLPGGLRKRQAKSNPEKPTESKQAVSKQTVSLSAPQKAVQSGDGETFYIDSDHYSALILDAKGLGVNQGESVRIITANGSELWSGAPSYATSAGGARGMELAGENPLVLKALRASGGEIVIGESGAERLREATSENPFLDSNCVIVVF